MQNSNTLFVEDDSEELHTFQQPEGEMSSQPPTLVGSARNSIAQGIPEPNAEELAEMKNDPFDAMEDALPVAEPSLQAREGRTPVSQTGQGKKRKRCEIDPEVQEVVDVDGEHSLTFLH
jgi:hypothetical protein